jgi:hypothetical protein
MRAADDRRYRPGTHLLSDLAPELAPVRVRWRRAAELAARQHGVVSRDQLRRCGLSDRQITRATALSRLHAVHRGVFAVGHERLSASGRRAAAVLTCGTGAALGYRTAAAHWNLRATSGPTIEIVVPRSSRPRHRNVRVHCHPQLLPDELTTRDGIRVTTVARTLLDLAAVLPPSALRRSVGQADVLRLFDRHAVAPLLLRHARHRGRRALEDVLRAWEEPDRVRSPQEETFPQLCARFGFPRPAINAVVLGMEVDAVFADHGIAVELGGYAFHSGAIQWEDDHEKRARLVAAGWTVLAYSWRQVQEDGGGLVRETLGAALARASTDARHPRYR